MQFYKPKFLCYLRQITLLLITILMSSLSYAQTETAYQQSLENISKEIKLLSRNINANKSKFEVEQTKLMKDERELVEINKKLTAAQAEIKQSMVLLEELNLEQQALVVQQTKSRQALAALITSNYKNGVPNQLKMLLNQENPYAIGRLSNYQTYFSAAITKKFTQLENELAEGRTLRSIQKIKVAELQNLEQEQEFLKQNKLKKNEQRRATLTRLNNKVAVAENKLKKLKTDRQRLNTLLEKLEKQKLELARIEKQRLEAERLAAEKAKKQGKKPVKKTVRKPVRGGFSKQKGRLTCPLDQTPSIKFGERIVSSGMRSEGMFFDTKRSIDVKSIFRGQVLFADFLKGFGLLIIVDHGDDHISLYGHNELLYKKVGDSVDTNEIISKTGTTGGLKSYGLYFELRKSATPINPMTWCQ